MYRLSDIDIRLLHVFRAVVECRGFSNAQAVLNIGQPTISIHINQLEQRFGFRLCDRGRAGFRLTRKGEQVYEQMLLLFQAHENFQNTTLELRGKLSGKLKLGLIDSTITDPSCPIVRSIELLSNKSADIGMRLSILTPNELERAVIDGNVDVALGTFGRNLPNLNYKHIYSEHNTLYCSAGHNLAKLRKPEEIKRAVAESRKVTRSYLEGEDLFPLGVDLSSTHASVEFLEAAAILLLGGGHIGFLPNHYAKTWEAKGKLVPILKSEYRYTSEFYVVTRKTLRSSVIVETFLADLNIAIDEIISGNAPENDIA